ncbi:hypothetical protein [Niabella beijingensis]|uniref:hypothetical protein n=1 Tax=Niabella beijingensis TaxID=2872700 RepID=UPI001CBAA263|nr:hypothetical protein [Niabella beijingensis]MBZ4191995.1 hypothetical protein [Niabella beijingensis]
MKHLFFLLIFCLSMINSFPQDTNWLNPLPATKEEFIKREPEVINVIDWLENTPLDQDADKRKYMNALLVGWLTNSPTVTVEVDSKVAPMSKKNPGLLPIFLGGWIKYSLQNAYSKDAVKCNLAGIKSVIKIYKAGNGIRKDKDIEKLVALDNKNELETWIASRLGKK